MDIIDGWCVPHALLLLVYIDDWYQDAPNPKIIPPSWFISEPPSPVPSVKKIGKAGGCDCRDVAGREALGVAGREALGVAPWQFPVSNQLISGM